jgi:thermolabile hemolysin
MYSLFNDVLAHPEAYGLTNTTESCLNITEENINTYYYQGALRDSCTDAPNKSDSFVYWDLLHPTTHMHGIVAEKVYCFIKEKFPTLPAAADGAQVPDCGDQ